MLIDKQNYRGGYKHVERNPIIHQSSSAAALMDNRCTPGDSLSDAIRGVSNVTRGYILTQESPLLVEVLSNTSAQANTRQVHAYSASHSENSPSPSKIRAIGNLRDTK